MLYSDWFSLITLVSPNVSTTMMQGDNENIKVLLGIASFTNYLAIYMIYHCGVVFCLYSITVLYNNLSILGYEPNPQRTSDMRSPSMRTQEVSIIPQLDGPGSLPVRDNIKGRVGGFLGQIEQDSSKGGTYVWRAPTTMRREYPGGDSNSDSYGGPYGDQRPPGRGGYPDGRPPDGGGRHPDREGYPGGGSPDGGRGPPRGGYPNGVGDPLEEEDTLPEDPLMQEEGTLDLLEDKDHQALKDLLDL